MRWCIKVSIFFQHMEKTASYSLFSGSKQQLVSHYFRHTPDILKDELLFLHFYYLSTKMKGLRWLFTTFTMCLSLLLMSVLILSTVNHQQQLPLVVMTPSLRSRWKRNRYLYLTTTSASDQGDREIKLTESNESLDQKGSLNSMCELDWFWFKSELNSLKLT